MILCCFFHYLCLLDTFKVNCPVNAAKMLMLTFENNVAPTQKPSFFFHYKKKSGYWQKIQSLSQGQPTPLLWPAAVQKPLKGQGSPRCHCQIKFLTKVHAVDSDTCLYHPTSSYLSLYRCLPIQPLTFFHKNTLNCKSFDPTHTSFPSLLPRFLSCLGMLPLFSSVRMELFLAGQLNVRGHNAG